MCLPDICCKIQYQEVRYLNQFTFRSLTPSICEEHYERCKYNESLNLKMEMIDYDLLLNDSVDARKISLKKLIDSAFYLIANHQENDRKTKVDHDAFILFQMVSLRCVKILDAANECNLVNEVNNSTLRVIDPFSVYSLVRTLFESYCNFNSIYVQSKSNDELSLKHALWVLSGLKYRQQFPATSAEHKIKKQTEEKLIASMTASIENCTIYKQFQPESQKNILSCIKKKKWHIIIDEREVRISHWQELFNCVISNNHFDMLYSSLSLNTHPSNISVCQFAELYVLDQQENSMKNALNLTNILMAFFITDYCQYFKPLTAAYSRLPINSKFVIEYQNGIRHIK